MLNNFYKEDWISTAIIENMEDLIIIIDNTEIIVYANNSFLKTCDYNKKEIIGKNILFLHPDKENYIKLREKIFNGEPWKGELGLKKKNGKFIKTELTIQPLKNIEGEVEGFVGNYKDISKIEKVKKNKKIEEKRIKTIFKKAPVGIALIDPLTGHVYEVNPRFEEIVGQSLEKMGKIDWINIFHSNDVLADLDSKEMVDTGEITGFNMKKRYIQINGSSVWIKMIVTPIAHVKRNNKIKSLLCVIDDITDLKKKELILENSNKELEEFAYIASHDMQEPLRVISIYSQLLKEKYYNSIDDEGKKYLDYSIDATFRMKTLIKELLDFSGIGRKDRSFEDIDLNNLVEVVLKDFSKAIQETGVNIIVEKDMPTISGIRFRIKQLLYNLISNSIKFRSKINPEIKIGCCEKSLKDYWLFYVKDNGIGIEPEYYDRIFGIFKRLYSKEEYPGSGIGLALCKRIVEIHGGEIWVDSTPNDVTYFYFTISKNKYFC